MNIATINVLLLPTFLLAAWLAAATDNEPEFKARERSAIILSGKYLAMTRLAIGNTLLDKHPSAAASWYRRAADQGLTEAQHNLGVLHYKGQGVKRDYVEAARWYRLAADQGYAQAQTALGYFYVRGYGVMADYGEAVRLFQSAAEQGNATGQNNLGAMYVEGWGVARDMVQAYAWISLAAEQEQDVAIAMKEQIATEMTPDQIAVGEALAAGYRRQIENRSAPGA